MNLLKLMFIAQSEGLMDKAVFVLSDSNTITFDNYFRLLEVKKSQYHKIKNINSNLLKGVAFYCDFQNPEVIPDAVFITKELEKINYFVC